MKFSLITGASGFIGRHVLKLGDRGLVRRSGGHPQGVVGDLLDKASLERACSGVDTVVHCAGYAHDIVGESPNLHRQVNYEGTVNLLEAAVSQGVRSFVNLSSVKAMAEPGRQCVDELWLAPPVTPYGLAKRAAEDAVLEAGAKHDFHVVNLRLAMVYGRGGRGNLQRMVRAIQSGWLPPLPETGNKRSIVYVADVVDAILQVADDPRANGRTYIVADPVAYSGRFFYDQIRQALGMAPVGWFVPQQIWRLTGALGDWVGQFSGALPSMRSSMVSRLLDSAWYSPERIEQELGWRAKVGFSEGIRRSLSAGLN